MSKHRWPAKTYTQLELEKFNKNGLKMYFSDPDRIDVGEVIFRRSASMIPVWITPNTLTICGLVCTIIIFLISFGISPAIENKMGEAAAKYVPTAICSTMAILQMAVFALDNWDGLHARGTNQCSNLGALLDHYFDAISTALNSAAMILLFNPSRFLCGVGACAGPIIFNMQLLTNYYLNEEPRVAGSEVLFGCMCIEMLTAILFYFELYDIVVYLSYVSALLTAFLLTKYFVLFVPKFMGNSRILLQFFLFCSSYGIIFFIYLRHWISTFELCICAVYVSWDFNGQIVGHYVVKDRLPIFKPHYFLIPIGVILEYYYFNPLLWMVDSKNNLHVTTLLFWLVVAYKNITFFLTTAHKL